MKNTIIILTVTVILFGAILSVFVIAKIKSSEPYHKSKEFIENNEDIKQDLGSIKGYGLLASGSVDEIETNGTATLSFQVKGESKNAQIQINLLKDSSGTWTVLNYKLRN